MKLCMGIAAAIQLGLAFAGSPQAQNSVTLSVNANMDIYRAGGYDDGSDGIAPLVYSFRAKGGRILTFSSVAGAWTCSPPVPEYGADGVANGAGCIPPSGNNMKPVGTFSGYHTTDFTGALVAMFLEDALPPSSPPSLRFYNTDNSQGGIATNFKELSPLIGQVFFIGDGLTGTGTGSIQVFRVPPTATHLYLGYIDSCNGGPLPGCYSDNLGSLTAVFHMTDFALNWVQPSLSTAPSNRCCAGIAYDATRHYTLLFGGGYSGVGNGSPQNDTWIWRNGWQQLSPATSPSARNGVTLAYDPIAGTVLLFGGVDASGNYLNDTWTWDGVTWTQQFPPVSPPGRQLDVPGMTYDAASKTVILFGGVESGYLGDTWEWNGRTKTWTQLFPATSPSARSTALAYDPVTREIVLFGGAGAGVYFNDTWTWDGITWTQQFPVASPAPRRVPSIAYDAKLGQVVLFGGVDDATGQVFDDGWLWNGRTWTQLKTSTNPGARSSGAMAFDPQSDGLVLFAGWFQCCTPYDDTWLLVPVPVR